MSAQTAPPTDHSTHEDMVEKMDHSIILWTNGSSTTEMKELIGHLCTRCQGALELSWTSTSRQT